MSHIDTVIVVTSVASAFSARWFVVEPKRPEERNVSYDPVTPDDPQVAVQKETCLNLQQQAPPVSGEGLKSRYD